MKIKHSHFTNIMRIIVEYPCADDCTPWHLAQAMMLFDSGEYNLDSLIIIGNNYHSVSELFSDFGIEVTDNSWVEILTNNILNEVENEYK